MSNCDRLLKPQPVSCSFDALLLRIPWVEVEEPGWQHPILQASHCREQSAIGSEPDSPLLARRITTLPLTYVTEFDTIHPAETGRSHQSKILLTVCLHFQTPKAPLVAVRLNNSVKSMIWWLRG